MTSLDEAVKTPHPFGKLFKFSFCEVVHIIYLHAE